jgi:colanic acid/amylovoran biosynthesis glycosyltransferase
MGSTLTVFSPLHATQTPQGELVVPKKFLTGLQAYASEWPGQVRSFLRTTSGQDSNLDHVVFRRSEWGFDLLSLGPGGKTLDDAVGGSSVVLVGEDQDSGEVADRCREREVPVVHVLEWNSRTRRQIIWQEAPGLLRKLVWSVRSEREAGRNRRRLAAAAGLQCNGTPTYEEFGPLNARSFLFFDSRVTREMVLGERELEERLSGLNRRDHLRLVFSGRLIGIKGILDLIEVARHLAGLRVPFQLEIFGGGDQENSVRDAIRLHGLSESVHLRGVLDFETELVPRIRRDADLFVCCHLQGDPSCTYLETFGCGVPIAGYANDALRGLIAQAPVGWTAPLRRPRELAERIAACWKDRGTLAAAARAARAFALEHTFEQSMKRRVEHLLSCARR